MAMSFLGFFLPPLYSGQGIAVASSPELLTETKQTNTKTKQNNKKHLQEKPVFLAKDHKMGVI